MSKVFSKIVIFKKKCYKEKLTNIEIFFIIKQSRNILFKNEKSKDFFVVYIPLSYITTLINLKKRQNEKIGRKFF